MALCKPSSFAENAVNLRHSNRQETAILQKKLSLMKNMERQTKHNHGIDSKLIAMRLKNNLQRSAQTEAKIGKMKSEMPCRESYEEENYGMLKALKDVWEGQGNLGMAEARKNDVTLPAAIQLLNSSGFEVEKQVTDKLEVMRKKQLKIERISKTSDKPKRNVTRANMRRASLPDLGTSDMPGIGDGQGMHGGGVMQDVRQSKNTVGNRKHSRPRLDSMSSCSSSSSKGITRRKIQRLRSQTQPDISVTVLPTREISDVGVLGEERPTSAPGKRSRNGGEKRKTTITVKASTVAWVEENSVKGVIASCVNTTPHFSTTNRDPSPTENEEIATETPEQGELAATMPEMAARKPVVETEDSSSDEKLRVYDDDSTTNQCPLKSLHAKIHSRMEDVTLVDLHRASVATKNYPQRMKTFVRDMKSYKIPESERQNLNTDYYAFRMHQGRDATMSRGIGRRAKSARGNRCMVTSLASESQPSSCCCSDCEEEEESELDDEQKYFANVRDSLAECRNRSLTIKSINAASGPSDFIECVL